MPKEKNPIYDITDKYISPEESRPAKIPAFLRMITSFPATRRQELPQKLSPGAMRNQYDEAAQQMLKPVQIDPEMFTFRGGI